MDQHSLSPILRSIDAAEALIGHRSKLAADAAQHVVDLENSLHTAIGERDKALNRLEANEEILSAVRDELAATKAELNQVRQENVEIQTKVDMSASVLLSIMGKPKTITDTETDGLKAVAEAIEPKIAGHQTTRRI